MSHETLLDILRFHRGPIHPAYPSWLSTTGSLLCAWVPLPVHVQHLNWPSSPSNRKSFLIYGSAGQGVDCSRFCDGSPGPPLGQKDLFLPSTGNATSWWPPDLCWRGLPFPKTCLFSETHLVAAWWFCSLRVKAPMKLTRTLLKPYYSSTSPSVQYCFLFSHRYQPWEYFLHVKKIYR